jgi:hypothetical protein
MKFFKTCLQAVYILLGTASMVVAPFAFFFYLLELNAFRSIIYAWLVCAFLSAFVLLPTGTTKTRKNRKTKRTILRIKKFFGSIFSTMKTGICNVYEEIFSEEYIED